MASPNKFEVFSENLAEGVHNLDTNTLKAYLSNAAPNYATQTVKGSGPAEISAGNGYTAGGEDLQNATSRSGGTTTVSAQPVDWEATSGSIGPFRYVVVYDDTPTSPADPLIVGYDYGGALTLNAGETFTVTWQSNALMTIA